MRSRRNNTTLTRKVDKWNPRKVWLIKRYADGHYAINQEVGGRVFYSSYIKTRNPAVFPKKERLGLAQRMMNEASDLVADLMEANDLLLTDPEERELRYRAQRSALRNCRKLIHHIELAHEILSGFGDDAFAYWAKMAAGVKNQTAKWYKTDKERAAKLDAQKRHQ